MGSSACPSRTAPLAANSSPAARMACPGRTRKRRPGWTASGSKLVAAVPALDGARGQRQVRERDDAFRVKEFYVAQAVAFRAGAHRVVEREQTRFQFLQRIT